MNLEEAIEYLKDYADWVNGMNPSYHDTMSVAIDTVLKELEKQKQIKQEMRKVAYEEGYIQGFNKCREKIMYMEVE